LANGKYGLLVSKIMHGDEPDKKFIFDRIFVTISEVIGPAMLRIKIKNENKDHEKKLLKPMFFPNLFR